MPQISIIVPVYNAKKYLQRCINSILEQEFQDFELILVNDGSSDGSYEILELYKKKDKRIVVLHQENAGVSAARNAGLKVAQGNYIGFVDADDTISKEMYQKLFLAIEDTKADIVVCNWKNIYPEYEEYATDIGDNKEICIMNQKELLEKIFVNGQRWMMCNVWNKLIKAHLAKSIFFDSNACFGEDTYYSYQLFMQVTKISSIGAALYNYYVYEGSASHGGVKGEKRLMGAQVYHVIATNLKERGYNQFSHKIYAYYLDLLIRFKNENLEDQEFVMLLKHTIRRQSFGILCCKEIPIKLKISYYMHMLKS